MSVDQELHDDLGDRARKAAESKKVIGLTGPGAGKQKTIANVFSRDPNEKVGPEGFGPQNYLVDGEMPYVIYFENDPTLATAPAQVVTITDQLDPDLDWSTFQLQEVRFGSTAVSLEGTPAHGANLVFVPELGVTVDIRADLNEQTGLATWVFQTLDPVTLLPTTDPLAGFLPPNQNKPEGEGYVAFRIRPDAASLTDTVITNQATIVFDTNDPIVTNTHLNTLDLLGPISAVNALPALSSSSIPVSWSGTDSGSGVSFFDVLVSVDAGPFTPWQEQVTTTSAVYPGQPGHTYGFYSVATDNVGHHEAASGASDATTVTNRPPTIESLSDSPDAVSPGQTLTLTANQVTDPDDAVVQVELYRDANGNGSLDVGTDTLLGSDASSADGWSLSAGTAGLALGTYTYFARAQDGIGDWSQPVSAQGEVINAPPAIGSLSDDPDPVIRGNPVTLTTGGINDPDGQVVQVELYRDANGNGSLDVGTDALLGSDVSGADGWSLSAGTAGLALGVHTYFARAQDGIGDWSQPISAQGEVINAPPAIASLSDDPDPVLRGNPVTLTANGVNDPNGQVVQVELYRDANGNGSLDVGTDALLGSDVSGADGWSLSAGTAGLALGVHTYFARAQDEDGAFSPAVSAQGSLINAPPAIGFLFATQDPVPQGQNITLMAGSVVDPDGTVTRVEFYRDANRDGQGDPEEKLGEDLSGADGWSFTAVASWPTGTHGFLARATDGDDGESNWASTTVGVGLEVIIGDGAARQLVYTDADGTVETVSLKGATARVLLEGEGLQQQLGKKGVTVTGADVKIAQVSLANTTARSALTFTGKGGDGLAAVGRITGDGPMGKIAGKGIDTVERIEVESVSSVELHDLRNGADLILPGAGPATGTTIKVRKIEAGTDIRLGSGLKSLTAAEWEDGTLQAPWAAKITIAGDFGADLALDGTGAPKQTLGKLTVNGNAHEARWEIAAGTTGTVNVAGWMDEIDLKAASVTSVTAGGLRKSRLFAGVRDDLQPQELPDSADDFAAPAEIKTFIVKGIPGVAGPSFADSRVAASAFGKISLQGVDPNSADSVFGIAADRIKSYTRGTVKRANLDAPGEADREGDYVARLI